jgi:hypothetical protein
VTRIVRVRGARGVLPRRGPRAVHERHRLHVERRRSPTGPVPRPGPHGPVTFHGRGAATVVIGRVGGEGVIAGRPARLAIGGVVEAPAARSTGLLARAVPIPIARLPLHGPRVRYGPDERWIGMGCQKKCGRFVGGRM